MDIYNSPVLPNVSEPQSIIVPKSTGMDLTVFYIALAFVVISITCWCYRDYCLFLSLGRGGPQYNVFGWFAIHIKARPFSLSPKHTRWTGDYPSDGAHKEIKNLPYRDGGRPVIKGIAPQRQFNQCPKPVMNKHVLNLLTAFAKINPDLLQTGLSQAEKHNLALFVHPTLLAKPASLPEIARVCHGELGHIHGESSLHLYFSPADAKVIIERGWAERHRMARTQPWWLGGKKHMWGIGDTFLIVYAPRNEDELDTLKLLIRASAMWMTGEQTIEQP